MGVAKHRKQRHAVAVVDGIIAPYAAGHVAAVEAEQLVQFESGKIKRSALVPIIPQRQHRRVVAAHRQPSFHPPVIILTISGNASSRLAVSSPGDAVRPVAAASALAAAMSRRYP